MIDPEVFEDALCTQVDPDIFFPERGGQSVKMAKSLCAQCPVALECLNDALLLEPEFNYGIWAGTSSSERLELKRNPTALERLREILKVRDVENRNTLNLNIIRGK